MEWNYIVLLRTQGLVIFLIFFVVLLQALFQSFLHCVVFTVGYMLNNLFKVKLFRFHIDFPSDFLLNLPLPQQLKILSDNFSLHVQFFLFLSQHSPIQFPVFSSVLLFVVKIDVIWHCYGVVIWIELFLGLGVFFYLFALLFVIDVVLEIEHGFF